MMKISYEFLYEFYISNDYKNYGKVILVVDIQKNNPVRKISKLNCQTSIAAENYKLI